MKMTRVFHWHDGTNSRFGSPGWVPAWMGNVRDLVEGRGFDPNTAGLGVAHDFFEHRLSDRGLPHQECMAFGAVFYGRRQGGYFDKFHTYNAVATGRELMGLLLDQDTGTEPNLAPHPRACRPHPALKRTELGDVWSLVDYNQKLLQGMSEDWAERQEYDQEPPLSKDFLDRASFWFCEGVAQAHRRYNNVADPVTLRYLFEELEFSINRHHHTDDDGDRLIVELESPGWRCAAISARQVCSNDRSLY